MKKKNKKRWKKYVVVFIAGLIAIAWVSLIKEGYRLPIAKRLSKVIPMWAIILNLVILLISVVLLTYKKILSKTGETLPFIVFTFSAIFFVITGDRLPSMVIPTVGIIVWISIIIRKTIDNKEDKEKSKKK